MLSHLGILHIEFLNKILLHITGVSTASIETEQRESFEVLKVFIIQSFLVVLVQNKYGIELKILILVGKLLVIMTWTLNN